MGRVLTVVAQVAGLALVVAGVVLVWGYEWAVLASGVALVVLGTAVEMSSSQKGGT